MFSRLLPAACAALLLAAPALANPEGDPEADAATLLGCIEANSYDAARSKCIGMISEPCMGTPNGGSTLGMSACMGREAEAWDVLLNAAWKEVMAQAKAADQQHAADGIGDTNVAEMLLTSQRAWLAFRDAECGYEYAFWSQGTIRTLMWGGCFLQMTAERTLDLRAKLNP